MGRILRVTVLVLFALSYRLSSAQTHVVINEVYGGGGNSGATYKNDFIELYNPTLAAVDISGWSVQYVSATGNGNWGVTIFPSGSIIPAGGYFLVQQAIGAGGTVNLPTPDATGTLALSGTAGKVALTNTSTALVGCTLTASVVDFIGFGATNCSEGTNPTPVLTNTTSAERKSPCVDTDNNGNDFRTTAPNPQNSTETGAASFTANYPKSQSITGTGFQVVTNLNKAGVVYFVVLPLGATAPTSAQVKAGQDGSSVSVGSGFSGTISVTSSAAEFTGTASNLSELTDYDVYVVAETCLLQVSPVKIQVSTISALDTTPPNFTTGYPKIQNVNPTGFQLVSNLNESGKTYYVILPDGATAPSATQVKAGQNADGTTNNVSGSISLANPNTEYTTNITSLVSATNYSVYFISEDLQANPNLQATVVKVDVSIPVYFIEAFNDCNGTGSFTSFSVTGDQVWGCVDFGYNSTKGIRMNGFASSSVANEDWLISPAVNLSAGAALSFYSQFSFAGSALQLKISTDYTGAGSPSAATWTNLNGNFPTVVAGSNSTSLSDWTLSNVSFTSYAGQKVYLAFVYTSTSSAAARWTLDEINVSNAVASYLSLTPSGLQFNTANTVKNYTLNGSNLASGVTVTAPSDFQISKDNSSFVSTFSFTATEANASPTIYVKFTGTGAQNYAGVVTHTSTGISSKNLSVTAVDKSKSFNITAYNLEFFGSNVADGSSEYGPVDDALQVANVTTVMQTIGSDIFSVEEVSDDESMNQLVAGLPGYNKLMADRWSYSFNGPDPTFPAQKIGIVYKTSTVQVVSSRVMFSKFYDDIRAAEATSVSAALALLPNYPSSGGNTPSNFWSSGRLPFMVTADVTVNAVKKRIKVVVLHSKSGSAQADYDRRKYDVKVLYDSLIAHNANDNIIILGDFNDNVSGSINTGSESTYKVFVDDVANFNSLTYPLAQNGGYSFPSSNSFLDHIIISNELNSDYITNSTVVEDPRTYIASYTTTTSDHLPVSARFALSSTSQTITFTALPVKTYGDVPFNLTATSSSGLNVTYTSSDESIASITGNTVTIKKAGAVSITASQAGNNQYAAATNVIQPLNISKASQVITFAAIPAKTFGDAAFNLSATSTSTLTPTFTTTATDKVTLAGSQVTIVKAGSVTIKASQTGNENFNSATVVEQTFCINPARPTVTLSNGNTETPLLTSSAATGNQWYLNGTAISGATNATYTAIAPGVYKVQVKADNCVSAFSSDASVIVTALEPSLFEKITLSPNPVESVLILSGLKENCHEALITDMTGRSQSILLDKQNDTYTADVRTLTAGIYVARIRQGSTIQQIKFIKK